ncbi:hypothetical protein HYN59_14965 [Flavobacterium album]|uniref:HNH endonuclease n=1 Tax=Flavobacterium album TaxID=2175091 RepID=A0A2S1R0Y0_9FLAO|nr:hypothetical protein [Flavobacterium album]AWH86328.1 hypothetical protein HYN59_14965 [Flavobacterium album]
MSCKRGKASPSPLVKLQLFADSGGYCQNPECNLHLFQNVGDSDFHIAEMAHIIAASGDGPRSSVVLSPVDKGSFENLILLCPNCHTKIDKAESEFPDNLIRRWKSDHSLKISRQFGIIRYSSRSEIRKVVMRIMLENKVIFDKFGPLTDERFNPESESPKKWREGIHKTILPNNRKLVQLVDINYELLNTEEELLFAEFKQHVSDFEDKHINNNEISGATFPVKMNKIFE